MPREIVTIVNPLGLHARAAAQVVKLAGRYKSRIEIGPANSDAFANARSIFGLLKLGAGRGCSLEIVTDGMDELEAITALR